MKKKLMAIALAVCVVAVLAAGASLAYFTDKTEAANNTFTMGNVKITLDETDLTKDGDSRTAEGNTYENLYPGMEMVKDPTVHNTGRNDAWVRVIVRVANGAAFMDKFAIAPYASSPLEGLTHGLGAGWQITASTNCRVPCSRKDRQNSRYLLKTCTRSPDDNSSGHYFWYFPQKGRVLRETDTAPVIQKRIRKSAKTKNTA